MDLNLTEQQEMVRRTARDFLDRECPTSFVREMEKDSRGVAFSLWQRLGELGLLGMAFPEEHGGGGQTLLDFIIVLEELGRAMFPGPVAQTVTGTGFAVLEFGDDAQRRRFLPGIAAGESLAALAFLEPQTSYNDTGISMEARARDTGFVLDGTKMFIPYADSVDLFVVAARTAGEPHDTEGVTVLLVDARSSGIEIEPLQVRGRDRPHAVHFKNVTAPGDGLLGEAGKGWDIVDRVRSLSALAQCGEAVGAMAAVSDMTIEYAKSRVQFGRPIGTFQAVQRHCTDMWSDTEGARYLTYEAAWRISQGIPARKEVAMAKSFVSDASRRVMESAHQVHGAIGLTDEHDLTMYNRRMTAAAVNYGDATFYREVVAEEMGL